MWLKIFLKEEEITRSRYASIFIGFLGIAYLFITRETGLMAQGNIFLGGGLAFLGVQSIAELITVPGEINLDFADVQAIMRNAGPAWMSIGYGIGETGQAV